MFDALVGLEGELRVPPKEFRLFVAGLNETEKGKFYFTEASQKTVMESWDRRKVDLTMDYEHQALHEPPIEAPNSCKRWVPQIRNGELWATECTWTDRAWSYLSAGEYRYFSPAFAHDDEGVILEVLNVALTNIPAMRGIAPLVAASRLKTGKETPAMDWEKLYKELQAAQEQLTAKLTALETQNAELTTKLSAATEGGTAVVEEVKTLTATLSLAAGADASARAGAVAQLTTFRSNVRGLTGADSDVVALGKIHAWKAADAEVTRLSARVNELENEKIAGEFKAVLDEASAKGLEPVERTKIEEGARAILGGRLTKEAITFAKTCLSSRAFIPPGGIKQPKTEGGGTVDPMQLHIARVCGTESRFETTQGK
jgi:phage I-like protein